MSELAKFESNSRRLHPSIFKDALLVGDAIPVLLPHFHLQGDSIFFLTSQRVFASLNKSEKAIWHAIDGTSSVNGLRKRFGESLDATIGRFVDLLVCELVPVYFPNNRRRVVVIEPHMDDAALSVGGTMWQRRYDCEFIIVTLVGISNFTTQGVIGREYFDSKTISQLRKDESEIFCRHIGGRHIAHHILEAPLRYSTDQWNLSWFRQHRKSIYAFVNHTAGPGEHEEWASIIENTIIEQQPDEVWMPLGLGYHVDHELTRSACLALFAAKPELFKGIICKFYQDVPYAVIAPNHMNDILSTLRNAGAQLEEERVDISAVMDEKLQLLTLFRSQFKIDPIRIRIEECARNAAVNAGNFGEVLYRLHKLPTNKVDQMATIAVKERVSSLVKGVVPWFKRNRHKPLIKILLAVGVGRWSEDVQYLLDNFPKAQFEIYVPSDCLIETETFISPRITIHAGENRWKGWFKNAIWTIISRPGPLVLISGGDDYRQKRYADMLSKVSIGSDSIVALTMNQFVLALRLADNMKEKKGVISEST